MKVFLKSFGGAVAGTLLVIITMYFFIKPENTETGYSTGFKQANYTEAVTSNKTPATAAPVSVPVAIAETQIDFTTAAGKSVNAVVHIKTEMAVKSAYYDNFFGPFRNYFYPQQPNNIVAFGSGVIISPDGYIVTNNHVVDGADKITVTFNDKTEKEARVIGTDPSTDLALIKVDDNNLEYLTYGDSDKLKVGEWVLAVGNPFNLTSTVTAGIVSAKARNINILGAPSAIESYIQTDAVVNRGNSGGALVNAKGELVGINAAIASHTGVYEGYSFAIPANIVKKVVEDLKNYGATQRGYLGVQVRNIDAHFAQSVGIDNLKGVYVAGVVDGSGADDAGIKSGDIILSIDGKPINSLSELTGIVGQYRPGDKVTVKIDTEEEGEELVQVTLKKRDNTITLVRHAESFYNSDLGAWLQQATDEELENMNISNGLKVTDLKDGILQRGGITKGFVIYNINGVAVNSENSLKTALKANKHNIVKLKGMYPDGVKISFEFIL
jgi:Do/DeqQ family serine protease